MLLCGSSFFFFFLVSENLRKEKGVIIDGRLERVWLNIFLIDFRNCDNYLWELM